MASFDMHWAQGQHNESLARELSRDIPIRYKDWAVIVAFYAALHFFEAYLATLSIHSENQKGAPHVFRAQQAKTHLSRKAAKAYEALYHASRLLRYLDLNGQFVSKVGGAWLTDEKVLSRARGKLETVKNEVAVRLGSPNSTLP